MYCKNCGSSMDGEFCPSCGARQGTDGQTTSQQNSSEVKVLGFKMDSTMFISLILSLIVTFLLGVLFGLIVLAVLAIYFYTRRVGNDTHLMKNSLMGSVTGICMGFLLIMLIF